MKKRLEIKNMYSILSVFGAVLLLLTSPCKVRNFIQIELGVSQTNVLNKSQSAFSQSNCQSFEDSEAIQTVSKSNMEQPTFLPFNSCRWDVEVSLHKKTFDERLSFRLNFIDVPLYILYQNIKIYL